MAEYIKVEPKMDNAWDFTQEDQDILEGKYVEAREHVGDNDSMLYTLELEDGERVAVWGSTVLDARMREVSLGNDVMIKYLGKEKSAKGGREYKNFEVYTKPHEDEVD